jgi:branched-chain amino acid transport system substrate-binding protein
MNQPESPAELRKLIRSGEWRSPTTGVAPGYVQTNLAMLPREEAFNFLLFCVRNPKPCPILEVLEPGVVVPKIAPGADLRSDLPRYNVFEQGKFKGEMQDVTKIFHDKMDGILGCYHSSVTKTVSAVAEQYGVPMINGSSTSPALTQRGFKWFWRTTPHDKWFTKDLFELLKGLNEGKVKGVKAVPKKELMNLASACEKTEWGSHVSSLIADIAKEYGFNLRKSLLYAAKSADLSSEVRSLKAARPDVMLFASYASDAILMVKTMKAQKVGTKVIWGQDAGFEKPEFRETLGEDIIGILTRTVFLPKVVEIKKLSGQVNALYKQKTGNDLGGASARAFTGLQTWVHVLEKAGSTKPADIQRAANAIFIPGKELVVPWAGIKFITAGDEVGQNVMGSGLIGQYQKQADGSIGLEIVYPFDVSSADMIFPMPQF